MFDGDATFVWSETSISECPGCGATVVVGIMSLCATCRTCGNYYVDTSTDRGWYFSRAHYENGGAPIPKVGVLDESTPHHSEDWLRALGAQDQLKEEALARRIGDE